MAMPASRRGSRGGSPVPQSLRAQRETRRPGCFTVPSGARRPSGMGPRWLPKQKPGSSLVASVVNAVPDRAVRLTRSPVQNAEPSNWTRLTLHGHHAETHWRERERELPDPVPRTDEEDFGTLLDNLDHLLQALLQQSFQQPRGEVTDLAYRACSSLAALRRVRAREEHAPHVNLTTPDSDADFQTNPLAEAQVTLRQLVLHHNDMTTGQLRGALYPLQDILSQTRRLVDRLGAPPHPAHWHEALAGLRNVANEAEATGLAIEEGGVASTHMAITALLAAVDRTSAYLDRMLADAAHRDEVDKSRKRKQEEPATGQTNRQLRARDDRPPRALPSPPALPVPPDGPAAHDSRVPPGQPSSSTQKHTGEATPYQILRAQQILEKLMPFLDQQAAAMLSEAHALLFGWTTALWGRPILLVDTEGTNPSNDDLPNPTMTIEAESLPAEFAAEADSSLQPTQPFWPPSPTGEPAGGIHVLARRDSHRRRRMHALFADEEDTNNLEHDGHSWTDDLH